MRVKQRKEPLRLTLDIERAVGTGPERPCQSLIRVELSHNYWPSRSSRRMPQRSKLSRSSVRQRLLSATGRPHRAAGHRQALWRRCGAALMLGQPGALPAKWLLPLIVLPQSRRRWVHPAASPGAVSMTPSGGPVMLGESQIPRYTGEKILLDFQNADINDILRLIAEVSGFNIIAGGDVQGTEPPAWSRCRGIRPSMSFSRLMDWRRSGGQYHSGGAHCTVYQ